MTFESREFAVSSSDGHRSTVLARIPPDATRTLLWLPALGVAARHYVPFAEALAQHGIAVFLHEWRGHGSSSLRAGRDVNWGYKELLTLDLAATESVIADAAPALPRVIGGHSLGGQLACCRLALAPESAEALWLVGSGSPYWRAFPARTRWWLPLVYRFLPWLAKLRGSLPGRTVGFGGNEARGLIRDWARTGLSGRYAAAGLESNLELLFGGVQTPVRAITLSDDWLGPEPSLRYLLDKLAATNETIKRMDAEALGTKADHFAWMKKSQGVAAALVPSHA